MAFSLEVTNQEQLKKEVDQQVKVEPEEVKEIRTQAETNASEIMATDIESLEKKKELLKSIESFGMDTIRSSATKNSLLQVSVGNLSKTGDEGGSIANGLLSLQMEIKDLDPSLIDFAKTGFLGKIFNPIRQYFARYQKADSVINDIIVSLDRGKATLLNDNTTLEIEQDTLRTLTKKLNKELQLGEMMDESISKQVEAAKLANEDPEKIKFVTEEILFPLRQRIMDMQQMIVVNHQGVIAIEVVIRNNKELIRGVERAKTVTISAMRIAAIVASALYNQKIVLTKIEKLNETTNELISGTSRMLKEQGADIQKQSMEANISVETLKTSFADVIAAMDAISAYKQEALPKMKETIVQFKELVEKGESEVQRLEKAK
ncbi:MAG: toxic anion resistance protein [Clostridia bacterium]